MLEDPPSSDDDPDFLAILEELGIDKPYVPTKPKTLRVRAPEKVTAVEGQSVSFDVCWNVSSADLMYTTWHVGTLFAVAPDKHFNIIQQSGAWVLVIKKVTLAMNGDVTVKLRFGFPHCNNILDTLTTSLTVIPAQEVVLYQRFSLSHMQGHFNLMPWRYSYMFPDDEPGRGDKRYRIIIPGGEWAKKLFEIRPRCRHHRDHTNFLVSFIRFRDGTYFMQPTLNGSDDVFVGLYMISHMSVPDITKVKELAVEWYARTCKCAFIVNKEIAPGQFEIEYKTLRHYSRLKAPEFDKLVMLSVRSCRKKKIPKYEKVEDELERYRPRVETRSIKKTNPGLIPKPLPLYPYFIRETSAVIDSGSFGQVRIVLGYDFQYAAAKFIPITSDKREEQAQEEFKHTRNLSHPGLVSMIEAFRSAEMYILILEYLPGGNLLQRVNNTPNLSESDILNYMKQILLVLDYMHKYGTFHLDVKPANVVFTSRNSNTLKLIDLGMAKNIHIDKKLRGIAGTRSYMSPEMRIGEEVSAACDIWSVGAMTFRLLKALTVTSQPRYAHDGGILLEKPIEPEMLNIPGTSEAVRDFLRITLKQDPLERPSASEALEHRCFKEQTGQKYPQVFTSWHEIVRRRTAYLWLVYRSLCKLREFIDKVKRREEEKKRRPRKKKGKYTISSESSSEDSDQ